MSLWTDKYRPHKLDEFIYNLDAVKIFKNLSQGLDLPHLMVDGISGIGKKSMVLAFLRECIDNCGLTGTEVYKTQNMCISQKYGVKAVDLHVQHSFYHYNLNPSNHGVYDRYVIQDFLKSLFRYRSITKFPYKIVIIRDAENLSKDAQESLRRTMETCVKNCRFIFMLNTNKQGNMIPALKSRCIRVRLGSPSREEALKIIRNMLENEGAGISKLFTDNFIKGFYNRCQGNLSQCINLLQLAYIKHPLEKIIKGTLIPVEVCMIGQACRIIVSKLFESKVLPLYDIRNIIYVLLAHGVNSEEIIKNIYKITLDNLPDKEPELTKLLDTVEFNIHKSSREFYHLENYIINLLCVIKNVNKPEGNINEDMNTNTQLVINEDNNAVQPPNSSVEPPNSLVQPSNSLIQPSNSLNSSVEELPALPEVPAAIIPEVPAVIPEVSIDTIPPLAVDVPSPTPPGSTKKLGKLTLTLKKKKPV